MKLIQLVESRTKLMGAFKPIEQSHHWMIIPDDDPEYDSDHPVCDHSDLRIGDVEGRWRHDSKEPDLLIWSDQPTDSQREIVSDFMARRGYQIRRHRLWAFSDSKRFDYYEDPTRHSHYRHSGD